MTAMQRQRLNELMQASERRERIVGACLTGGKVLLLTVAAVAIISAIVLLWGVIKPGDLITFVTYFSP